MLKFWPLSSPNLAVVVIAASFTAGLAGGVAIDRNIMQARVDRLVAAHATELAAREAQHARDQIAAREEERRLVARAGEIEQRKTDEIARIRDTHAAALAGLQQRANRKPTAAGGVPGPAPACQGSTGAELSREDSSFLVGEAARADELRAALSACYQAYDSVAR